MNLMIKNDEKIKDEKLWMEIKKMIEITELEK